MDRSHWGTLPATSCIVAFLGSLSAGMICEVKDAAAQELRVVPSVTVETVFTDNENFERDGEEELLLRVIPRVQISRPVGRVALSLDAALAAEYSVLDEEFRLSDSGGLAADSQLEIIERLFFVDLEAAITSEIIAPELGAAGREYGDNDNRTLAQRYRVSPFLIYDLGSFAEVENRVTLGYVDSGSSRADEAVETGARVNIASGSMFSRFGWNLLGDHVRIEEGDGERFEHTTAAASLIVPIESRFSLLGDVGVDLIEDDSVRNTPDGFFWSAGFRAVPGPKLDLTAKYGQRYEHDNYFLDLIYRATPRTRFTASFNQTVETEQQILLDDLRFLGRDEDGNLIDPRTNEPIDITDGLDPDFFGLGDGTVLRDVFRARLSHSRRRDVFALDARYETRESLSDVPGRDQTIYGGDLSWDRRLSRATSGTLSIGYTRAEYDDLEQREDDLITFRSNFSYRLSPTLIASASYIFRNRFSTEREREATENVVVLSMTKTF